MSKVYHFAARMRDDGAVSALCFGSPRKIDLSRASWTIRPEAVTCEKCREKLAENCSDCAQVATETGGVDQRCLMHK